VTLMETAQLLGNVGEFVGAIAVVLTLGYLTVQIRQSNIAAQTAAIQGFFDSFESVMSMDIPFIHVLRKGYTMRWEDIPKDEQVQLHMYWANYLAKLHMGYRLYVRQVLDHASYIGFEDYLISALKSPALRTWWGEHSQTFPSDYRQRLDERLHDPADTRPLMRNVHAMWAAD